MIAPVAADLERERAGRPVAVAGAALAAILPLAGAVAGALALRDQPRDSASRLLFFDDHAAALIGSAVILSLGALALVPALRYLYDATRARRPETPRTALVCAVAGPVALAVAQVVSQAILASKAAAFADPAQGNQTYQEAKAVLESGALRASAGGLLAGQLMLGFAFVTIALNAMRVGLLTRFIGVLGIIVGVLFVVPIGTPLPIVQSFWLGSMAVLFSGRWPGGLPPAWVTGEAQPWPTQQELRERREGAAVVPEPEPIPATDGPGPAHPRSRKRKRKRRR